MAVTRIEEGGLGTDSFNLPITLNGTDGSSTDAGDNLVLDASASGVDAGERLLYNGITPDLAGNFSSNVNVLSGVTLTIDDGATIVNSGTATGFGSNTPSSADGQALGSTTAEWSDLYLADGGIVYFGNDQEITLTHSADSGLLLKHTATADDKPINLTLQTGETDIAQDDVLGKISFQAPDEGTGTDAILVAAAIQADSEGDFSSSSNATSLQFMTGSSEAATAKVYFDSTGNVGIGESSPSSYYGNTRLVISDTTSGETAALTLRSATDGVGFIAFADSNSGNARFAGYVEYQHSSDLLSFGIAQSAEVRLSATAFYPSSADGTALGLSTNEWSDLFLADGAVINFGNDQEVTLTHVADTGLLLSSTDQLQFGDSGTYIHQSADGVLDLVSDTEIEINATTIDINGNVDISGD